jgi:uncharacterized protein (DUF58 family)
MPGLERPAKVSPFDRRHFEEKGVVLPIKRLAIRFMPGRHQLGRAGDGMRFLRNRPYEILEDNPRDIDKFSPQHALMVNEWEHETQAEVLILADVSASMAYPAKSSLRDAVILQLIYSLWRSGDRVRVALFAHDVIHEIHKANLRAEMNEYQRAVAELALLPETDIKKVLEPYVTQYDKGRISLIILVSDFIDSDTANGPVIPIELLRRLQGDLISVVVTFNLGEEAQGVGKVWDPERNREGIVMLSRNRRSRINHAEQERVDQVCRAMRDAYVDSIAIREQRQIYPQLLSLARTREHRRL